VTADPLAMLSEKHVLVLFGGKALVSYQEGDTLSFATVAAMKALYANLYVSVKVSDGNGGETVQRKSAFDLWMRSGKRPTAEGITIDPAAGRITEDGKLNAWRGFGVEPKAGDWSLIRELIEDVLCDGNREHAQYIFRWLAWKLQHPTEKTDVALVLRGKKGTGKGSLARLMLTLFGSHGLQVSSAKHLTGNFNGHLADALLVNADEAFWAGDRNAEGALKRQITEPTITIERKGVDAYEAPNRIAYIVTANAQWVFPASEDERRAAVFNVGEKRQGDFEWFKRLNKEIANGGAAAFLHAALRADLGDWHPREDIPQTDGLALQQQESADPEVLWLGAILNEGMLPGYVRDEAGELKRVAHPNDPTLARSQLLWRHAKAVDSRLRYWTEPAFGKFLEQFGVVAGKRAAAGRFKQFPPLAECRRLFQQAYPWFEFESSAGKWHLAPAKPAWEGDNLLLRRAEQDEERGDT
jgi:hypothetical protein